MVSKFFSSLHQQALPRESQDVALFLKSDSAPEVRIAAAERCSDIAVLADALMAEADCAVRAALGNALATALAATPDGARAQAMLEADPCTDQVRSRVACLTQDTERRAIAIGAIRAEEPLVELALGAETAETRITAAERVQSLDALKRLADAAKDKDRGVARLARQRIDAMNEQVRRQHQADAIIAQLEALALEPGAILTAVVELDRRWQALGLTEDPECLARFEAARSAIQARFDREQDEPRRRFQFERRLRECIAALDSQARAEPANLDALRTELEALHEEAVQLQHGEALSQIAKAQQGIRQRDEEREAEVRAEALVTEAELASATSTDSAQFHSRWQALNAAGRTPALKRRFKAALQTIEQRHTEQQDSAKQDAIARRHQLHGVLHTAEQALAAGQLQSARAAADEVKALRAEAGELPKPTTQRLGRLLQQLGELERWESFGQQSARTQLCERAEALTTETVDAAQLALEVRKLRDEWKALDQQHAGVPKALWLRFDGACEKAYAPAARHFAELGARNKEARRRRKEFIDAAEAHVPSLLGESPDWRAAEQWLRETDRAWREGELGSIDPASWKKLDAKLRAVLAPVRNALSGAGEQAKARRRELIGEATALLPNAMERETPGRVKALQARWQAEAKAVPIARRDERALWEQFRGACDALFAAREAKRKEEGEQKNSERRALEDVCVQLERLSVDTGQDDPTLRRLARELQEQWNAKSGAPGMRELQSRFSHAKSSLESLLSARARSRKTAVWQTLEKKERLCEELDRLVREAAGDAGTRVAAVQEQWSALPAMPPAWEDQLSGRRDAALEALTDEDAAAEYRERIEDNAASRRQGLVELELLLGLQSPAEDQSYRLALQVKRLKDRFQRSATADTEGAGEQLLAWCAQPGLCEEPERQRSERIFSKIAQTLLKS